MWQVNENGYYGQFGGAYIPEMLYNNVEKLKENYLKIINEKAFKKNLIPFKRLCWKANTIIFC